jgi:hypothetical protein
VDEEFGDDGFMFDEEGEIVDSTGSNMDTFRKRKKKGTRRQQQEALAREKARRDSIAMAEGDSSHFMNDSLGADSINFEEDIEEVSSEIDSTLLAQQIAELEEELRNLQEVKEAERLQKEGKSEEIVLKIKVPKCRYKNEVIYTREKFKFIYEYDFFMYYFHQRFFHKRKFYDIVDTAQIMVKPAMDIVGKTMYRKVDFNKVVDSVSSMLPDLPVEDFMDSIITELNLEYLATGEIKVKYRKRNQKKIVAKLKPTALEDRDLGNIKFYTRNRRTVIEQLDGSDWEWTLPPVDSTELLALGDSIAKMKAALSGKADTTFVIDSISGDTIDMIVTSPNSQPPPAGNSDKSSSDEESGSGPEGNADAERSEENGNDEAVKEDEEESEEESEE